MPMNWDSANCPGIAIVVLCLWQMQGPCCQQPACLKGAALCCWWQAYLRGKVCAVISEFAIADQFGICVFGSPSTLLRLGVWICMGSFLVRSARWPLHPNTSLSPFCAGSFPGDEHRLLNCPGWTLWLGSAACAAIQALSLGQVVWCFATCDAFPVCKTEVVFLQSYKLVLVLEAFNWKCCRNTEWFMCSGFWLHSLRSWVGLIKRSGKLLLEALCNTWTICDQSQYDSKCPALFFGLLIAALDITLKIWSVIFHMFSYSILKLG